MSLGKMKCTVAKNVEKAAKCCNRSRSKGQGQSKTLIHTHAMCVCEEEGYTFGMLDAL